MLLPLFLSATLFLRAVVALGQKEIIDFHGGYKLADKNSAVEIIVHNDDWKGVIRGANDLAADFGKVTGLNGSVTLQGADTTGKDNKTWWWPPNQHHDDGHRHGGTIIVGTIGKSPLIDELVSARKIDVKGVKGEWESFVSHVVQNPIHGVGSALVIAGSDKRGSIYGLYDVSEQIGVSPWHFFADVPSQKHDEIYAKRTKKVQGPPSVKYRGFFINDEAPALTGWINANYPQGKYGPGYNTDFYVHVFELLLRLRANLLWPAMWNSMFGVDDNRNQPTADEFGIVMSNSHTEPMMRATKEWDVFGEGPWQWNTNNASIKPFFVEGIERAKPYENLITIGMRGSGDTAMSGDVEISMLEDIVKSQREIISNIYGEDQLTKIPQQWCLYAEVSGYYDKGMRVPDDVTLLWADDNWGNIRRLPKGNETERSGGAGIYYHFDYVGGPRDYKWINTVELRRTWEQMNLAYEKDAKEIWVVNVGDIKPLEIPINHFFDLAYDVSRWNSDSVLEWLELWATREFGDENSKKIARILSRYSKMAALRKYEVVDASTYSLINYDEADKVLEAWDKLGNEAQAIYDSLSADAQAAFFELVLHPVLAGGTDEHVQITAARNRLYAWQGRNSANVLASQTLSKFRLDRELTQRYHDLLEGKWQHMMDQTHIGYRQWQQPMRQATPPVQYIEPFERALTGDMGVTVEATNASVPGDDMYHDNGSNSLKMLPLESFGPQKRWIDIFSVGTQTFNFEISAEPFVSFSQTKGTIAPGGGNDTTDTRVWASVDWDKVPSPSGNTTINITSSTDYGAQFSMPTLLLIWKKTEVPDSFKAGHVENDGVISIEAENFNKKQSGPVIKTSSDKIHGDVAYVPLPDYGRFEGGVMLYPPTAPSQQAPGAPYLSYPFYTFTDTANATLTLFLGPSLNSNPDAKLRYAVQIDDQDVQTVEYVTDLPAGKIAAVGWEEAVVNNAWANQTTGWEVKPGGHELKVWALEPSVILMKAVLDLGGLRTSYFGPPESHRVDV